MPRSSTRWSAGCCGLQTSRGMSPTNGSSSIATALRRWCAPTGRRSWRWRTISSTRRYYARATWSGRYGAPRAGTTSHRPPLRPGSRCLPVWSSTIRRLPSGLAIDYSALLRHGRWPMTDPLTRARALAALGCSIIPIPPGTKKPSIRWASYQTERATDDQLRSWFGVGRTEAMAIITGAVSGLVVVDTDSPEAEEWARANLPATRAMVRTSKGWHRYYRAPDVPVRNAARIQTGQGKLALDVRGDGGYVLAPGSPHPDGGLYEPTEPWTEELLAGIPVFRVEWLATPPAPSAPSAPSAPGRPSAYDRARAWLERRDPAVEGAGGDQWTYVTACNLVVDFGLTDSEALELLRPWNQTCQPPWTEGELLAKIASARKSGNGVAGAKLDAPPSEPARARLEEEPGGDWPEPIPFESWDPPPFPLEVLPGWLAEFVTGLATATQTPSDLPAMLALSTIGVATMGKVEIEARPGWREPLNLYTVTALDSGNRKSAVFRDVTRPLYAEMMEASERNRDRIHRARLEREGLESQLAGLKKRGKDGSVDVDAMMELQIRIDDLAEITEAPRLLADDVTPEGAAILLHRNSGRLGILSPEGDLFQVLKGRYSNNNGKTHNFAIFLKGYSGDPHQVDRASITSKSLFIPQPLIGIGIATQPSVVAGLCSTEEFNDMGLLARFIYSIPSDLLGRRVTNPPPLEARLANMYAARLRRLFGWPKPEEAHTIRLSPEARDVLEWFLATLEPELAESGLLGDIRKWGAKLAGNVLRIAGNLHLAQHATEQAEPWDVPLSADTLRRVIHLADVYLIPHARSAMSLMGRSQANEDALFLLRWIQGRKLTTFTKREAFIHGRARFQKVENIEPVLELLCERNYVRRRAAPPREGRPKVEFEVHPSFVNIVSFVLKGKNSLSSSLYSKENPIGAPFQPSLEASPPQSHFISIPPAQNSQNSQNSPGEDAHFISIPPAQNSQNSQNSPEWTDSERDQLEDLL
ncbi:DUF3987 domain-containing protein [bacterium CPR1]|nr:DUF3987 domain-containing protein [bacterium CPR1]